MMTSETPWQRRIIAAADVVVLLMGYCFAVREKPAYALIAVLAACVSMLCRLLWRLEGEHKGRRPHEAAR
jgi:hypothetical protein